MIIVFLKISSELELLISKIIFTVTLSYGNYMFQSACDCKTVDLDTLCIANSQFRYQLSTVHHAQLTSDAVSDVITFTIIQFKFNS